MFDIVSYLREYSDARLEQEHRVIAHAGETLLRQIEAVLGGAIVPRAEIEVAAATYLVYYAKEEEDVLTRAAQHLAREDWEAVKAAVPAGQDPLFGTDSHKRYRELRRQIALQA